MSPREKKPLRIRSITSRSPWIGVVVVHRPIALRLQAHTLPARSSRTGRNSPRPTSSRISMLAPSRVPMVSAPFMQNFMLPVPGGLLAGGGDLLRQIGRRIDPLAVGDVEVRQEHHFQPVAHVRIAVDHIAHRGDQLDHELREVITGRRLAAENEGARLDLERRIRLDARDTARRCAAPSGAGACIRECASPARRKSNSGSMTDAGVAAGPGPPSSCLLSCLISRQRARNSASSASGSSAFELRQILDPARADVLGDEIRELADCDSTIQRRGVTPLVLLLNFCGHIS